MKSSPLRLGMSTNVLAGYDPSWLSAPHAHGLFETPSQPLLEDEAEAPETRGNWSYPVITLHEDAEDLLNELFPARIQNPGLATEEVGFSSGTLLLRDADRAQALKQLQTLTGVDLSSEGRGYALVRLYRKDTTQIHASGQSGILVHAHPVNPDPELGVQDTFRQGLARLRPCLGDANQFDPKKLDEVIVQEYLGFYGNYGTHFVSAIEMGNCIFQVFAYDADRFARVKTAMASTMNSFKDEKAANFAYYTTSAKKGTFGYAAEIGNVVSFGDAKAFRKSLTEKLWMENEWAKADSIFAMFNGGSKVMPADLDLLFKESVPVRYQLTTLTLFSETQRRGAWNRILSGAMVQKFPLHTHPNLKTYFRVDADMLFGEDSYSGFASAIATPNINVYKPRVKPESLRFVATDTVENFTLVTNLISMKDETGTFVVPGKKVILSTQALVAETQENIATITVPALKDKAARFLYCAQFFGVCQVGNAGSDNACTLVDGIRLVTKVTKGEARGVINTDGDIRKVPPAADMKLMKPNLQFSYTFLQLAFNSNLAQSNPDIPGFLKTGLEWVALQIPENTKDANLLNIKLVATDLAANNAVLHQGSFVPVLPGKEYESGVASILGLLKDVYSDYKHAQEMIELRKVEELVINVGKTLNQNIISSGKALTGYIETTANFQQSMSGYYDSIVKNQEDDYQVAMKDIDLMVVKVEEQQTVVNRAVETYKNKVKTWITMKAIKATFEIITGVFTAIGGGGGGKAADATKEVTELAKTIEKIKKIVTILGALGKAYQTGTQAAKDIRNATTAMEAADGANSLMISKQEWDEMLINLDFILGGGPEDGEAREAKDALLAAYKILMLRGKAMLEARANAARLGREMFNNQRLKDMAREQAADLKNIKASFTNIKADDLDTSTVDLVGLTSSMDALQNQMLTMLSSTFLIKDQALRYEFQQPSTPIQSFDLFGFQGAIIKQNANTVVAKTQQGRLQKGESTVISYLIEGIPVSELTGGNSFRVSIGLDSREFFRYVNVRVKSVVPVIRTKVSTPNGVVLLNLNYVGDPFLDRGSSREKMTYHTESRNRTYDYESGTMNPLFADKGNSWSKDVNPVTPFSTWELSFPNTAENKDISFGSTLVDIVLTFTIDARINDESALNAPRNGMMRAAMMVAGSDNRPSTADVIAKMAERGKVTNNWDVVYNMSLSKINDSFAQQYEKYKKSPSFTNRIQVAIKSKVKTNVYAIKKFDITYGYPNLNFLANNQNHASLTCLINGSIQECLQIKDDPEECDPPITIKEETLKAIIPISKVTGIVNPVKPGSQVYSVLLSMAEGTFSVENMDLSDEEKVEFNKELKAYFTHHPVVFIINSLDLSDIATLPDLRPNQFLFKTLTTHNNNQILQLFIQTSNRMALNESQAFLNDVPEPIPAGHDSSLIISSKVFFNSVLPASIQGGWSLKGVDPFADRKPWRSEFTQGNVTGNVDTSRLTETSSDGGMGYSNYSITKVFMNMNESNDVSWSVAGMNITPTGRGTMQLSFKQEKDIPFVTKTEMTSCTIIGCKTTPSSHQYSTKITVTIGAAMPLVLSGEGKAQKIAVNISDKSVSIDGRMSGGGPCGCDDMQAQLNKAINNQIPGQLTSKLNVPFNQVSVFALQNLVFPDAVIKFKSVAIPGDMVIFGDF